MDYKELFWWAIVVIIVMYMYIQHKISNNQKTSDEYEKKMKGLSDIISQRDMHIKNFTHLNEMQKIQFQKAESDLKLKSKEWALTEFEKFKSAELEAIKKQLEDNAIASAANLLQKWKIENEYKIRQDAANRSYAVNLGKITEHLVPFHTNFPFNPKDARFIGSPIDLIVFDGLDDDESEIKIYFVEIKTGKSRLSSRQARIKSAVEKREIIWYPVNSDDL